MSDPIKVRTLLAEDNPTDALLLEQALGEARGVEFAITRVESLAECMERCAPGAFDVLLLDLGLPDSTGLETFLTVRGKVPELPILVLTALTDEETGLQAVKMGAQDYLIKGQVQISLLGRVIRYAVERHHLQRELEDRQQRESHDREVLSMQRLADPPGTQVTGRIYASLPLRESHAEEFQDLIGRYRRALDLAIEQRIYKTPPPQEDILRDMGQELGFLRAGPRDVIEIHSSCIRAIVADGPTAKAQAYLEESRITVLELMGHLAGYYRNFYSSSVRKGATK